MEYTYKTYAKEVESIKGEHKIATLSDLNIDFNSTMGELNDLFLSINDRLPEYIFLLGNMFIFFWFSCIRLVKFHESV